MSFKVFCCALTILILVSFRDSNWISSSFKAENFFSNLETSLFKLKISF